MLDPVQIVVTFDPATQRINVQAPIEDKILCFRLLTAAINVVAAADVPKVGVAPEGVLQHLPGNGRN